MMRTVITVVLAITAVLANPVSAQDPQPFADFTFKRVKVPTSGSGNRIKVQIDPAEQAAYLRPPSPEPSATPESPAPDLAPEEAYAWYWSVVPPGQSKASSARLEQAVNHLANSPIGKAVPAPRLQTMQDIASSHGIEILKATIGTGVSPALVLAVIGVESSGRTDAISSAGAAGLMQLIPDTAKRFGVADSKDPAENIRGGVAYLDWLMKEFDNDPVLVLAAYNAGENAVRRHEGVPPYAETRAYVPKVFAAWAVARGLCLTPPQLMSDGCVFAVREAKN